MSCLHLMVQDAVFTCKVQHVWVLCCIVGALDGGWGVLCRV